MIRESTTAERTLSLHAPPDTRDAPGLWHRVASVVQRKPLGAASALVILVLLVVAVLAPVLAPYDFAPGQTTFMLDFFVDAARLGHEPAHPVDLAAGRP